MIRKSRAEDKDAIQSLIHVCFGDRKDSEPCEHLEGRYYLNFKEGVLVAMTGFTTDSEYHHLKVDWTCTHPDYRHNGYMQELFATMLDGVFADVYCSCWRLPNRDTVNLYTLMNMFGFREAVHTRVHWKVPYNCFCDKVDDCTHFTGTHCECYEDLYVRRATE